MSHRATIAVRRAVQAALNGPGCIVLAVSGGLDSMVLLDAAAAVVSQDRLVVATFDHATGPAATAARELVMARAAALDIPCVSSRSECNLRSEADFRTARWAFLRRVANDEAASIATAHTASDQVETVFMRILRDAGARGIAGLAAPSEVLRPLISFRRSDVAAYAKARGLSWVEDPSNHAPRYLRNRIRWDLLPALGKVAPTLEMELLELGRRAAEWRCEVDAFIAVNVPLRHFGDRRGLDVDAAALIGIEATDASQLWPAILVGAGVVLDRRGIERVSDFGARSRVGARMQLRGGWEIVRARDVFQLRRALDTAKAREASPATVQTVALSKQMTWGDWSFRALDGSAALRALGPSDVWSANLPVDRPLSVRPWLPGDTVAPEGGRRPRKLKRMLSAAGITGHQRMRWPVVLAGDEIVWVPGVHRVNAVAARLDKPGLVFVCDYFYRDILRRSAIVGSKGPKDRLSEGRHR